MKRLWSEPLASLVAPYWKPTKPPWWRFRARRIYRQAVREFRRYGAEL